ncbi:MAG: acetyl-CoA C-acyltransferase [bacterium]
MELNEVVAISACRTPMGNFGGTLKDIPSYDLGAVSIKEAIRRANVNPDDIDEVLLGSCRQAGNGPNPARSAAVKGGVPLSVPVMTINMACPSGMKALSLASQVIRCGEGKIVLIGGFDSMSTIPYLMKNVRWDGFRMGNKTLEDGWSDSVDPLIGQGMGDTAENLFEKFKISREEQDEFAVESHLKSSQAQKNGWFKEEIVPVEIPATRQKPAYLFENDETIRHTIDKEKMAKLKPAFRKDGVVTAGNACGLSDGSTALVITTRQMADQLGVKPLFSIISFSQAAVPPQTMGEGPGLSIPAALKNAGMQLSDMDLIEVNEAFAIQVLANEKVLNWDRSKLNVHGGAIALGHPTGISGARIIVTLYYALKRLDKTFGVAGICGGGGVTMATVIKREL